MPQRVDAVSGYRRTRFQAMLEGLRYSGGSGQWAWLIHRITGLGILLYLLIHIWDTFVVIFDPSLYDATIALYGGTAGGAYYRIIRWAFRLGELGLIASVVFHAINGLRVIAFDLMPAKATLRQKELFWAVLGVFLVIMIPVTIVVSLPLLEAPPPPPTIGD